MRAPFRQDFVDGVFDITRIPLKTRRFDPHSNTEHSAPLRWLSSALHQYCKTLDFQSIRKGLVLNWRFLELGYPGFDLAAR